MKLYKNIIVAILMCLPLLSTGCMLDEMDIEPAVVYYNGAYGYWSGGYWYAAPQGYRYGLRPYWGPYYRGGYNYHQARPYYQPAPFYRGGFRGGFHGGRR